MVQPDRHEVCQHTQRAARRRKGAFKTDVERTFPDLPKTQVNIIANLAEMAFCQLDPRDMDEKDPGGPAIRYERRPEQPR